MLLSSLIHIKEHLKNVFVLGEEVLFSIKTELIENHVNRESKRFELKIKLYICFYEDEAPKSCNATVYLSWLLRSEDVLGGKVHS